MMIDNQVGIVIAGAGQAGCAAAVALRQAGYAKSIVMIGEEPYAPYQRPPLSKAFLLGKVNQEGLLLRPLEFFEQHSIELILGDRVVSIDRNRRAVHTELGRLLNYEYLILATGAEASRPPLPGAMHPEVRILRDLSHALDLKNQWKLGQHLCVIGGGFIGLEVAASARDTGLNVTVLEGADRLLSRVASPALSDFMKEIHRIHGVCIKLSTQVSALEFDSSNNCTIKCSDGSDLKADLVLLATGARPRDDIAKAAGLHCERGISVDALGRTEDPHVLAIGDCSISPPHPGRSSRLESIPSANEQARRVAALLAGQTPGPLEVPWFWSDQFDLKLQMAGHRGPDAIAITRGNPSTSRFSIFHVGPDHRIQAVESVNDSGSFMAARVWLRRPEALHLERLADPNTALVSVPISQPTLQEET